MRTYTVVLEYDAAEPGYSVRMPALPGCYTQGDTVEEALANAREAIEGHIATLEQMGAPAPEEGSVVPSATIEAVANAGPEERILISRVAA